MKRKASEAGSETLAKQLARLGGRPGSLRVWAPCVTATASVAVLGTDFLRKGKPKEGNGGVLAERNG